MAARKSTKNQKNPQKSRMRPPKNINPDALAVWHELLKSHEAQDPAMLEVASVLLSQFRADPIGFPAPKLSALRQFLAALKPKVLQEPQADAGIWAGLLDAGVGAAEK
jgi:hypothetical protein